MSFAARFDPREYRDPAAIYDSWTRLAGEPATFSEAINGLVAGAKPGVPSLLVARHADADFVLKQPRLFPAPGHLIPPLPQPSPAVRREMRFWPWAPNMLFGTEPWTAPPIRRLVAQSWARPKLEERRADFCRSAAALLEPLPPAGQMELISTFSRPLVIRILMVDVLGMPAEACEGVDALAADQQRLFMDAMALVPLSQADVEEISQRQLEQRTRMLAQISALQVDPLAKGLVADLLHARLDESIAATVEEAFNVVHHVLLALDNPILFIGVALDYFTRNRHLWADILRDPALTGSYLEEALRLHPPLPVMQTRLATADTEIGDVSVPKGSLIALHVGAANRDAAVFANPTEFRSDRSNIQESLTFSGGAHRCLAPWLGRMIVDAGVGAIARRFPDLRRTGEPAVPYPGLQDGFEKINFAWGGEL